jgi:hypothetical protein
MRFMVDIPDNVGVPGDELVEGIKKRLASVELRNGAVYFMDSVSVHQQEFATDDEIQFARDRHGEEGEVEIDEPAIVSRGADDGCYVQAWVWVPAPLVVYELTLPGFDGGTDETDDLVLWISCPNTGEMCEKLKAIAADFGCTWCGPVPGEGDAIDFEFPHEVEELLARLREANHVA